MNLLMSILKNPALGVLFRYIVVASGTSATVAADDPAVQAVSGLVAAGTAIYAAFRKQPAK